MKINQDKMTPPILISAPVVVHVIISFMSKGCFCYVWDALPDNCTCARKGHPTYSLFTMPRSRIIYNDAQDYTYTFFPCGPDNLISPRKPDKESCKNVALCQYDTTGTPHVYKDIGEQKDVKCEATDDYPFALKYAVTSGPFTGGGSTVRIECSSDPSAKLVPVSTSSINMIFILKTPCGCPNRCLAPTSTKPGPTAAPLDWEMDILLSIAAVALLAMCLFLWWRGFIRLPCRICRHDHDNRGGGVGERGASENTSLINDREQNYHAIEHEDSGAERNLTEPVQVEEGDVKDECKFVTRGIGAVVV